MVRIDIFDFLNSKRKGFERKTLEETNKDIMDLYEYNIAFEHLENSSLFGSASMHVDNDSFMKFKLLVSEVNEKQEIIRKLDMLSRNISLLRSTSSRGILNIHLTEKILRDDYCGLNRVISDVATLKSGLENMEKLHDKLMESSFPLDVKAIMQQEFANRHKKLKQAYEKKRNILMNLSYIFLSMAKNSLKGK